ncbi:MAG: glycosyltransferase family 4 protein [Planctomycetota bacterium]|jgi:glycosyltransferase involved in cell wall biosynthesis
MKNKPKILYVTTALHAPPHGGCMIRTANICRQLKKYAELTMLAVSSNYVPEAVTLCEKEFQPFYKVDLRSYDSYPSRCGQILKKWHMHNPVSRGIRAAKKDQELFLGLAAQHDIVWFHTLGAAHPFKIGPIRPKVMDLDDLKDSYYDQYADVTPNLRFKCSAKVQAYKWKKHQDAALKKCDRIIVCSDSDKNAIGRSEKIRIIPNGYTSPEKKPEWSRPDSNRIGFIGLLSYPPNRDGLIWFRDNVWSLIRKERPSASLRIIGKRPTPDNYVECEGFEYLGFLEETTEEMKTWSAMSVPIPYGGGTRIKILDAFSKMCPVVSTQIGVHGIRAENQKHILVADDPEIFAAHCIGLLDSREKGRALAEEAWHLFSKNYSWDVIGLSLKKIIDEFIS